MNFSDLARQHRKSLARLSSSLANVQELVTLHCMAKYYIGAKLSYRTIKIVFTEEIIKCRVYKQTRGKGYGGKKKPLTSPPPPPPPNLPSSSPTVERETILQPVKLVFVV